MLESIAFIGIKFEDNVDFKRVLEGVEKNRKLIKLSLQNIVFNEELFGKSIGRTLTENRFIRELDMSYCVFEHPKCFYDICMALLNERCRVNVFKLRGVLLTPLEAKIVQFILMKNKQLTTLDISHCKADDSDTFAIFIHKLNELSNIRYLTMENLNTDTGPTICILGETLATNLKLEVLILRENKIKWTAYQTFWNNLMPNTTLQKINLYKTDLSDRVVERMAIYLEQPNINLMDLDLSKNAITDTGLKVLSNSLKHNRSVKFLNLKANRIKEDGLNEFVDFLIRNKTLEELSLSEN